MYTYELLNTKEGVIFLFCMAAILVIAGIVHLLKKYRERKRSRW